jgi:hypothetical protein
MSTDAPTNNPTPAFPVVARPTAGSTLTKKELAGSRLYPNIKTPEQAAVVIAKAKSYGLCSTSVADGLFFVGGKPSLSAQLVATLVKRSEKYDFRVRKKDATECKIEFFEKVGDKLDSLGVETFTMKMAERARLAGGDNWKKFPEAMLWARCLTAGVRAHCPDALGGNPVYSVEELSPTTPVDAEGRPVIEADDAVIIDAALAAKHAEVRELLPKSGVDAAKFREHYAISDVDDLDDDAATAAIVFLRNRIELLAS